MRKMFPGLRDAFRRAVAAEDGGTAVEMAIVLPTFTLMIIGAIYAGWVLFTTNMLYFAVEQAARCSAVNATACGTPALTQSYAVTQAIGVPVTTASFTVTSPACGARVQASYPFTFLMPFQTNIVMTLTASACYPTD